ncbi:peroxin [Recurvomyces mirabilis]|uniref:Peroxin n=1 Tax=Recurvomyces mirabilis TaxID=574656 RepID=A0AAE0WRN1_9PEZI|nr:peroxin [Recurvomyces mirabilis]KAK5154928.1 peroxin [Recurvomyces mirabilis]
MIAASRRWLRRNRTGLLVGAGVLGAGYLAGQYVLGKIQEARQRSTEDQMAKENLRRRFEQNQEDCTYTVLALLPTIKEEIIDALPVEQITEQLQQERTDRLKRLGGSEAATSEYPSVPPSVADENGKSMSSSSFVHASQMVSSVTDGSSSAPRPKRSKAQLWQDMKIHSITRALTLIYTVSLLAMFTRIQLNLLGRRTYLSSVVSLASPPTAQQASTISLENRDDDGYDNVYGNDFETNRKYLTFSWWLLHRGSKRLMENVMEAVKEVFGQVNIREDMTMERLSELLIEVRRKIEGATSEERSQMKWLSYLLPPREQELEVIRRARASENGESPLPGAQDSDYIAVGGTEVSASLRRLLDETADLIDSPTFCQVLTRVLDAAYSHLVDYRIATESFNVTGPTAPGTDQPRVTEITENKCKLAHILPVFCKQAYLMAAGSGDLEMSSIVAPEGPGNEYLAAIDGVHELDAFAAVIYSSNFEAELEERETVAAPLEEKSTRSQRNEEPMSFERDAPANDEPIVAGAEGEAETTEDPVQPLETVPAVTSSEAGLEAAWQNALAKEDGKLSVEAPVPVEDE